MGGETREAAERQSFWNEWFEIFGIRRRRFVIFERNVQRLSGNTGQIDAFWPGMLLIEHKSAGEDLNEAMRQAEDYFQLDCYGHLMPGSEAEAATLLDTYLDAADRARTEDQARSAAVAV